MASDACDGIACSILIQNGQLEQVDTFSSLGSLITEDGEYDGIAYQVNQGAGDRGITAENMEKSQHTNFNGDIMKALRQCGLAVATYGCGSWTLRKNEETRLHAFEIKGLQGRFCGFRGQKKKQMSGELSWSKEGTVRHRQSKEASILWSHHEETRELPARKIDNTKNNARYTQARKTTHGLDGQHQYVNRTPRGRVKQNDRGQR